MPETLVTVGTYSTSYEANLVRGELEAFEFHANLLDSSTIDVNWLWSNALGGVKVQVPESEFAEACQILESEPSDTEALPDTAGTPAPACPHCGSLHTDYYLDKRGSFLTWLILGVPLVPAASKRVCTECQSRWRV